MIPRDQRGSSILLAMIVVLTVAVIGVAMINYASREVAGSTAGRKRQELVACAEAGRQLLLSQFKAVGVPVTNLTALDVSLDGNTEVRGGHYDAVNVVQVSRLPAWTAGRTRPSSINWRISTGELSGAPYKVVVHCQTSGDRQLEVEYGVRFGL